ncbi:hypothetical protein B0H13DRAFT_2574627 [Mycena leptocephala]|nr:hypothetical protein B0H13DRAFT_2574627 [Mycena leptocephala]
MEFGRLATTLTISGGYVFRFQGGIVRVTGCITDVVRAGTPLRSQRSVLSARTMIMLIPLHETVYPEVDSIASMPNNDNGKPLELEVRIPKINTEYLPYVVFSSLPFNGNKDKGTFDIDIGQYTQLSKGGPLTVLPASCLIIDSPRWPSNKPVPYPRKFVLASGHVVAMENKQINGSPYKSRFKIIVDNVVYLGNNNDPSMPATSSLSKWKIAPTFDGTPSGVKHHNNGGTPSSSPSGF